ncbi:MAG: hypothetical protein C5B59_06775 [Bacteroidetes bacterium]|nr:MAG: hypothetical protein C5B59_06775 [Bacteroidota bacterium]
MKKVLAVVILLISSFAIASDKDLEYPSSVPRPFGEVGIALNDAGSSPASFVSDVGLNWETRRFSNTTMFSYNSAKKDNDNTVGNFKGHSISASDMLLFKLKKDWLVGADYGYGRLNTTLYSKQGETLGAVIGKDYFSREWSFRLTGEYFKQFNERTDYPDAPGCKCTNGIQGASVGFWIPSPDTNHHFFFHESVSVYHEHATITDPSDPVTTAKEKADTAIAGAASLKLMIRF